MGKSVGENHHVFTVACLWTMEILVKNEVVSEFCERSINSFLRQIVLYRENFCVAVRKADQLISLLELKCKFIAYFSVCSDKGKILKRWSCKHYISIDFDLHWGSISMRVMIQPCLDDWVSMFSWCRIKAKKLLSYLKFHHHFGSIFSLYWSIWWEAWVSWDLI